MLQYVLANLGLTICHTQYILIKRGKKKFHKGPYTWKINLKRDNSQHKKTYLMFPLCDRVQGHALKAGTKFQSEYIAVALYTQHLYNIQLNIQHINIYPLFQLPNSHSSHLSTRTLLNSNTTVQVQLK